MMTQRYNNNLGLTPIQRQVAKRLLGVDGYPHISLAYMARMGELGSKKTIYSAWKWGKHKIIRALSLPEEDFSTLCEEEPFYPDLKKTHPDITADTLGDYVKQREDWLSLTLSDRERQVAETVLNLNGRPHVSLTCLGMTGEFGDSSHVHQAYYRAMHKMYKALLLSEISEIDFRLLCGIESTYTNLFKTHPDITADTLGDYVKQREDWLSLTLSDRERQVAETVLGLAGNHPKSLQDLEKSGELGGYVRNAWFRARHKIEQALSLPQTEFELLCRMEPLYRDLADIPMEQVIDIVRRKSYIHNLQLTDNQRSVLITLLGLNGDKPQTISETGRLLYPHSPVGSSGSVVRHMQLGLVKLQRALELDLESFDELCGLDDFYRILRDRYGDVPYEEIIATIPRGSTASSHPPIDPIVVFKEEIGAGREIDGVEQRRLLVALRNGDTGAREELLRVALRYVPQIAEYYRGYGRSAGLDLGDLIQIASIVLWLGLDNWTGENLDDFVRETTRKAITSEIRRVTYSGTTDSLDREICQEGRHGTYTLKEVIPDNTTGDPLKWVLANEVLSERGLDDFETELFL